MKLNYLAKEVHSKFGSLQSQENPTAVLAPSCIPQKFWHRQPDVGNAHGSHVFGGQIKQLWSVPTREQIIMVKNKPQQQASADTSQRDAE